MAAGQEDAPPGSPEYAANGVSTYPDQQHNDDETLDEPLGGHPSGGGEPPSYQSPQLQLPFQRSTSALQAQDNLNLHALAEPFSPFSPPTPSSDVGSIYTTHAGGLATSPGAKGQPERTSQHSSRFHTPGGSSEEGSPTHPRNLNFAIPEQDANAAANTAGDDDDRSSLAEGDEQDAAEDPGLDAAAASISPEVGLVRGSPRVAPVFSTSSQAMSSPSLKTPPKTPPHGKKPITPRSSAAATEAHAFGGVELTSVRIVDPGSSDRLDRLTSSPAAAKGSPNSKPSQLLGNPDGAARSSSSASLPSSAWGDDWAKFHAVMTKNVILKTRGWMAACTVLELIVPLVFIALMCLPRALISDTTRGAVFHRPHPLPSLAWAGVGAAPNGGAHLLVETCG